MFLFIPLHSSVANVRRIQTNLIFLLSDPDGRLSFIYFVESFEVFIQLETTINCLKQETWGVVLLFLKTKAKFKYCFYQNKFMFYS